MYFEIAEITASLWLLLVWGILVGFVFSTVGAAGGILASVGMISVFGLQDPNLVKPMAQTLTLATPLIAVPLYRRSVQQSVNIPRKMDCVVFSVSCWC